VIALSFVERLGGNDLRSDLGGETLGLLQLFFRSPSFDFLLREWKKIAVRYCAPRPGLAVDLRGIVFSQKTFNRLL